MAGHYLQSGHQRNLHYRLGKLLLSVTAMAIIGNSHTDDPVCAWLTGSTCSLANIGLAACVIGSLCGVKEQVTSFPFAFQITLGQGHRHESTGSTSGSTSGLSESAGTGCSWPDMSLGCNIGVVSVSGSLDNPAGDFWLGQGVESDRVSATAS